MVIRNLTRHTQLADRAALADTFFSRMKGLLGRDALEPGEALVITHCNSIHMMFMRFAIDVVFVNRENTVVGLAERIPPFRFSRVFWKAERAIELPAGTIRETGTCLGDLLELS